MIIVSFFLGLALLMFGRKVFWICVGGIGFLAGMALAAHYFHGQSDSLKVVIGLGTGILGAVLAFFLQRIAVGFAGFIAGAYVAYAAVERMSAGPDHAVWLPVLIGGILGTIVLLMAFDWTLIVLSSLTGAAFIVQSVHPRESLEILFFVGLTVTGIVIQSGLLRRRHPQPGHAASKG